MIPSNSSKPRAHCGQTAVRDWLVVLALVVGSGCRLHVRAERLGSGGPSTATCPRAVPVVASRDGVGAPHQAVARITTWHPADMRRPSGATLLDALRRKAAQLGANAFVVGADSGSGLAVYVPTDSARAAAICAAPAGG